MTHALIIRDPWVGLIMSGKKTWEMRSTNTKMRGLVGLIRQGSGQVVGLANLIETLPALTSDDYARFESYHQIPLKDQPAAISRRWTRPWVFAAARSIPKPISYEHGSGPVTWIKLHAEVVSAIRIQIPA